MTPDEHAAEIAKRRIDFAYTMNRLERSAKAFNTALYRGSAGAEKLREELALAKAQKTESGKHLDAALRAYYEAGGRNIAILRRWTP